MNQRAGFWATIVTVFSAFIGIRKRDGYQRDAAQFKPVHLIVAGVIGGVVFVLTIVTVVKVVISQAAG